MKPTLLKQIGRIVLSGVHGGPGVPTVIAKHRHCSKERVHLNQAVSLFDPRRVLALDSRVAQIMLDNQPISLLSHPDQERLGGYAERAFGSILSQVQGTLHPNLGLIKLEFRDVSPVLQCSIVAIIFAENGHREEAVLARSKLHVYHDIEFSGRHRFPVMCRREDRLPPEVFQVSALEEEAQEAVA